MGFAKLRFFNMIRDDECELKTSSERFMKPNKGLCHNCDIWASINISYLAFKRFYNFKIFRHNRVLTQLPASKP